MPLGLFPFARHHGPFLAPASYNYSIITTNIASTKDKDDQAEGYLLKAIGPFENTDNVNELANIFDEYKSLVKEIRPDFFNNLQSKTGGKLTELDIQYRIYIYLKVPSKQMANLLHVEYNIIRMNNE